MRDLPRRVCRRASRIGGSVTRPRVAPGEGAAGAGRRAYGEYTCRLYTACLPTMCHHSVLAVPAQLLHPPWHPRCSDRHCGRLGDQLGTSWGPHPEDGPDSGKSVDIGDGGANPWGRPHAAGRPCYAFSTFALLQALMRDALDHRGQPRPGTAGSGSRGPGPRRACPWAPLPAGLRTPAVLLADTGRWDARSPVGPRCRAEGGEHRSMMWTRQDPCRNVLLPAVRRARLHAVSLG